MSKCSGATGERKHRAGVNPAPPAIPGSPRPRSSARRKSTGRRERLRPCPAPPGPPPGDARSPRSQRSPRGPAPAARGGGAPGSLRVRSDGGCWRAGSRSHRIRGRPSAGPPERAPPRRRCPLHGPVAGQAPRPGTTRALASARAGDGGTARRPWAPATSSRILAPFRTGT